METQVYFSNVGITNFVEDLGMIKSHLETIAKENTKGVDLRRITVDGDSLNKKILGYKIIDFKIKEESSIKAYELLEDKYVPISRFL